MTTLVQVLESPELSALFWPTLEGLVRDMAVRRVTTSLVLNHVALEAGLEVSKDEIFDAINNEARANPGREKVVFDYYRTDPQAQGRIKAEVLAEKTIDHILSKVQLTERRVPRGEFLFQCACEGLVDERRKAKPA